MQVLLTSISRIFLEVKMRRLNKIRETNWGKIKEQDSPFDLIFPTGMNGSLLPRSSAIVFRGLSDLI